MSNDSIIVVGVDPAPSKGLCVFADPPKGELESNYKIHEIGNFMNHMDGLAEGKPVLICWDAPLTGPQSEVAGGKLEKITKHSFTKRTIERFFTNKSGLKVPKGINIRDYSGLSHWTVTKALFGLPRIGRYDGINPKFNLISSDDNRKIIRPSIIETHPAVAVWIWCKDKIEERDDWSYKGGSNKKEREVKKTFMSEMWVIIKNSFQNDFNKFDWSDPDDDDSFDAKISCLLGKMWLVDNDDEKRKVVLLGNEDSGSILVPNVIDIKKKFGAFR